MLGRAVAWEIFGANAAENYEAYLVPSIFAPFAKELLSVAGLRASEWVLDVACGTGILARLAATEVGDGGAVVGLDLNPSMLDEAKRVSENPHARWLQASADAAPLPDGEFDVVFCQQGMQFFPDRPAAAREMYRLLKPVGRLVVSVWAEVAPGFAALADGLSRLVGPDAGAALAKGPYSLTDANELSAVVTAGGFTASTVSRTSLTVAFPTPSDFVIRYLASTPLAATVRDVDDAVRVALLKDVSERLQNYMVAGELRFPMVTHVLTGRKGSSRPSVRG